jgi:predicted nucleic acid-binding protein
MVALWLCHDNDHDQRVVEGSASGLEEARCDAWPQFEYGSHRGAGIQRPQPAGGGRGNYSAGAPISQFTQVQGDGGGFEALHGRRPRVIVADNSLLVYFWLPSAFAGLAEAVKDRDKVWASPILWRSEFRNVLAGYLRRQTLTEAEANAAYLNVQKDLGANEYSVPTERIIKLVLASDCSAYDCEYVALAQDLGVPLVTAAKQILRAFPNIAVSLEKFTKKK